MLDSILMNISIDKIDYGTRFRAEMSVEDLKESISDRGLIQPIAVKDNGDGTYLLLAGGRRTTACKQLGHMKIPAKIFDKSIDEFDVRCIELAENIQRKDMRYSERAALTLRIQELYEQKYGKALKSSAGHSVADTANLINVSTETARQDIELAKAIELMPSLGEAKNRTEALRLWNKKKLDVLHEELAKRLEDKNVVTDKDKRLSALASSYVIGDFFTGVKQIPDGTMHVCEVDPPYAINLNEIKKSKGKGTVLDCYNEVPQDEYLVFINKVIKECYRVLIPNGWMLMWFAPEPWFEPMFRAIVSAGFELKRMPIIWTKPGGSFQSHWPEFELANSYEMLFYARKGVATLNNAGRKNEFSYQPVSSAKKIHPTERPIELIEDLLSTFASPGSRLLVPFAGSGNTLLAAANLGMKSIGWDLEASYKNSYTVKVYEKNLGKYKSYEE